MTSVDDESNPMPKRPDAPEALRRVLEKTGALEDPFQQLHLLAGALAKASGAESDGWEGFSRDLASHLMAAAPTTLAVGGEPGPALDKARKAIERVANGQPIELMTARDVMMAAIDEVRRNSRDRADVIEIHNAEDKKRFREMMEDKLLVALVAAVVLTAQAIKSVAATAQGIERLAALQAGLGAGVEALSERGYEFKPDFQEIIDDARRVNAPEFKPGIKNGQRDSDQLGR